MAPSSSPAEAGAWPTPPRLAPTTCRIERLAGAFRAPGAPPIEWSPGRALSHGQSGGTAQSSAGTGSGPQSGNGAPGLGPAWNR